MLTIEASRPRTAGAGVRGYNKEERPKLDGPGHFPNRGPWPDGKGGAHTPCKVPPSVPFRTWPSQSSLSSCISNAKVLPMRPGMKISSIVSGLTRPVPRSAVKGEGAQGRPSEGSSLPQVSSRKFGGIPHVTSGGGSALFFMRPLSVIRPTLLWIRPILVLQNKHTGKYIFDS
jgi:hypothetical protein